MTRTLTVNGRRVELDVADMTSLLDVLRDRLALTGAKSACGEGRCGACTVHIDGRPVVACLYPAALADGRSVKTVEGLAGPEDALTPLQDALLSHGAVQCGACTPGIVMTLTALLETHASPDEAAIRDALAGNLCRCTGYRAVIDAALSLAGGERA